MKSVFTWLFTLVSWSLISAPVPVQLINLEASPSCGPLHHETNTDPGDPNGQSLRVYFSDFSVVSRAHESTELNCHMRARLRIPANVQFRARHATVEGVYKIVGQAFSGFLLSYQLMSLDSKSSKHELFDADSHGDFNFSSTMEEEKFTPCIGYDTEIDLASVLHAFIDQRSDHTSIVSLDETGNRLSWSWKVKACQADLFSRTFATYFIAANARRYRASMTIDGDHGNFRSEEGFTGDLFDLRRSEDGRVLEGKWSAQGLGGRIKFTIVDAQSGQFIGHWWDSDGRKGNWSGSYE